MLEIILNVHIIGIKESTVKHEFFSAFFLVFLKSEISAEIVFFQGKYFRNGA